ncbi:HEPN domain-containing protein [Sodalis ligni]|uniref:RiboL-PSP-HEPN domain-containing protein n=1 Tax=Sodalis ligni TaxID=2697027 RepID=A0A4R1NAE5_9GAMM|nr:HEPN domain-containing protein [Sodalis ligni]TCL03687.1 hypothetical protein EZJ58_1764 [Sodalis ligni]
MGYTKSAARKDFEAHLAIYEEQVRYVSLKVNLIRDDICQCVYKNAIFQTSAAFEEYIKSILEDWIDMLLRRDATLDKLPKELLLFATGRLQKNAFSGLLLNGDEKQFINKISGIRNLKYFFTETSQIKGLVKSHEFVRDRKYPSEKNIKALFYRFGLDNIFDEINHRGKRDFKKVLESFSDSRTAIAHDHVTISLNLQEVKLKLQAVRDIIVVLDKVLYKHVCSISGPEFWKKDTLLLPV